MPGLGRLCHGKAVRRCAAESSARPAASRALGDGLLLAEKNLACDPGKEHWRAAGNAKRGGTFVRPERSIPHLDPSQPGGNSNYQPQIYEHLVDTRACYYEDTMFVPALARAGQLDQNHVNGYLKRDFDALVQANPKFTTRQDVAPIPRGMWFNLAVPPWDDVRMRKAIFYAIDHDEVVQGGFQGGAIRSGHLPSAIVEYVWPPDKVRELFKPDLAKSQQLLAEAGYGRGHPFKFAMKTGTVPQDLGGAEVVQHQLQQAGMDVSIDQYQGFVATALQSKQYSIAWGGMTPASIFPDRWMGGFLRCGDSRNLTNLCDPEIDQLSLAQAKELDHAKRKVILDKMQQRLFDQMYCCV